VTEKVAIVWFRNDLRLADHPALQRALSSNARIVALYIYSPDEAGDWAPGAASRVWLHQSLRSLRSALSGRGNQLVIRRGDSLKALLDVVAQTGATEVYANAQYEPARRQRDDEIAQALSAVGCEFERLNGNLLVAPGSIVTQDGSPYRVFTPFWKNFLANFTIGPAEPAPTKIPALHKPVDSLTISSLGLLPTHPWADALLKHWQPGEDSGQKILASLDDELVADYPENRDLPAAPGTTRLSPYLHFGELSPRQVASRLEQVRTFHSETGVIRGADTILRQLLWRDFAHHVLVHFPATTDTPMNARFSAFPWQRDDHLLQAWQRGQTGIPIVDAGMRELWHTGWMHNRVRMLCASLLTKNMKIHWLEGARWFWDTLVDADLAQNSMNWQWVAGSGVDAAPYFRIFNPVTQGEKFDADGMYVRRWVPELSKLPSKWIHRPWQAPADVLHTSGVSIDGNYPYPVVDIAQSRLDALAAYKKLAGNDAGTKSRRSAA
jgi:deoxyribodipyrimidine photo-lyase